MWTFQASAFGKEKYFITFIDDFSRYEYIYLLHEKSQSVDALEVFINEVERQLDRKVKIVRSDRGGEYYGRYDEMGQHPGLFAKFLEKRDICAQPNIQCQEHHNKMVLQKGAIVL